MLTLRQLLVLLSSTVLGALMGLVCYYAHLNPFFVLMSVFIVGCCLGALAFNHENSN